MHLLAILAPGTLISVLEAGSERADFHKGGRDEFLTVMRLGSWLGEWHKGVEGVALVQHSGLCVDTLVNVSSSPAHKLLYASVVPFCLVLASVLTFVATRIE